MKIELTTSMNDIIPYIDNKMFDGIVSYVHYKPNFTLDEYIRKCIDQINQFFAFLWRDMEAPVEKKLKAIIQFGILGESWMKASTGIFEDGKISLHLAYTENVAVFDYEAGSADDVIREFMTAIAELKD